MKKHDESLALGIVCFHTPDAAIIVAGCLSPLFDKVQKGKASFFCYFSFRRLKERKVVFTVFSIKKGAYAPQINSVQKPSRAAFQIPGRG